MHMTGLARISHDMSESMLTASCKLLSDYFRLKDAMF